MKRLFVFLLICSVPSVYAGDDDAIPIVTMICIGLGSIPIITLGSLIKIGFVKCFTRVRWKQVTIVAIMMNVISFVLGLPVLYTILNRVFDSRSNLIAIFGCLLTYILMVFFYTWIEGEIIYMKLGHSLSKTFRWLSVANAITIVICAICTYLFIDKSVYW